MEEKIKLILSIFFVILSKPTSRRNKNKQLSFNAINLINNDDDPGDHNSINNDDNSNIYFAVLYEPKESADLVTADVGFEKWICIYNTRIIYKEDGKIKGKVLNPISFNYKNEKDDDTIAPTYKSQYYQFTIPKNVEIKEILFDSIYFETGQYDLMQLTKKPPTDETGIDSYTTANFELLQTIKIK
ncbi:hypothetical protein CPAV1605_108 [seawater metagenome]|uniref:Uncharacterized protein n=1 Tax=seawater metagenome TaxID=1561972 RepID=A0A5E8CH80_9ZZZZ